MDRKVIIENTINRLASLKIKKVQREECAKYLNFEFDDVSFFEQLPNINFKNIHYKVKHEFSDDYKLLKDSDDFVFIVRYFNLMTAIGQKTFFYLIMSWHDSFVKNTYFKFLLPEKLRILFLSWCAEATTNEWRSFNPHDSVFITFNYVYKNNICDFEEAYKITNAYGKMFISAFLLCKDSEKYKEHGIWLKTSFEDSLQCALRVKNLEEITALVLKYMNGELFKDEDTLSTIIQNDNETHFNVIFEFQIGIACLAYGSLNIMKKYIRMMVMLDYNTAFNYLKNVLNYELSNEEEKFFHLTIESIIKDLKIPEERYIAWLSNYVMVEYTGAKSILESKMPIDVDVLKRASKLAYDSGKVYLLMLISTYNSEQPKSNEIEELFIKLLDDFFREEKIPEAEHEKYMSYLKGEIDFSSIKESVRKVLRKKKIIVYNRNLFIDINKCKDKTALHHRSLTLFVHAIQTDIVNYISPYNKYLPLMGKPNVGLSLESFVNTLEASGVQNDGVIPFLAELAAGWHHGSITYRAQELLNELIIKDADEIANNITYCNADSRAYLLLQLFKFDNSKYTKLLIDNMDDPSKLVQEAIVLSLSNSTELSNIVVSLLKDKRTVVRECAVSILSSWNNEVSVAVLKAALETEKNEKVRSLITNKLNPA